MPPINPNDGLIGHIRDYYTPDEIARLQAVREVEHRQREAIQQAEGQIYEATRRIEGAIFSPSVTVFAQRYQNVALMEGRSAIRRRGTISATEIHGFARLSYIERYPQAITKWTFSNAVTLGDKQMKKRKSMYEFTRIDTPKRFKRDAAIKSYSAIRRLRLEAAAITRTSVSLGAHNLATVAQNTVRAYRQDYNAHLDNDSTPVYSIVRKFEGRRMELRLIGGTERMEDWKKIKERFQSQIQRYRADRRAENPDPLDRPSNYYLQKGTIKILNRRKDPTNVHSVGIEIECLLPHKTDFTKFWPVAKYVNLGSDGSIRTPNGYQGAELRVCVPSNEMRKVVTVLSQVLSEVGAKVNASCGLHVHLDQRQKTDDQIKTTFANFIRAQNLLMTVVPQSRRNNHYCKKHRGTDLNSAMYGNRYKMINAVAYRRYKTLEIRLFNGTVNGDKIINWIETLWAIEKGTPVLRCPKTFDIAKRYWPLSENNLKWLKARQEKFKDVAPDNTDVADVETIEEEENINV